MKGESLGDWLKRLIVYIWYDVIFCMYIGIICFINDICTTPPVPSLEEMQRRTGQVAVITGGPRGLALGLIKRLTQLEYKIIMGVRDPNDARKRLAAFAKCNGNLRLDNVVFLEMDLRSLASVRTFASTLLKKTSRVDLLLCNAAIMQATGGGCILTEDGFESQFQVNYLSNFLLINLLLERLRDTSDLKGLPCQIVYSSSTFYKHGTFCADELGSGSFSTPLKSYYTSKMCQVMHVLHLQKMLEEEGAQVNCYAVHPGMIPTDMWFTGGGYVVGRIGQLASKILRTIQNGADTIL